MTDFDSPLVDERVARIALACATEPSDLHMTRLVGRVGAVEAVRVAAGSGAIPGMDTATSEMWRRRLAPRLTMTVTERALEAATVRGLRVLIPADRDWPAGLVDLAAHAPLALWAKGNTGLLHAPVRERVALIGARACTSYGSSIARDLAVDLSIVGRQIVNGGAYSIDASAMRGVLDGNGMPIVILPSGVDRLYPSGNAELLARVGDEGVLLSELPPGQAPTKWRLEQRDRLVAAIAGATVVVEAGARSGTLRTAADAVVLGRRVGAIPGPVGAATSGTHRLIREGTATLVEHLDDIQNLLTGRDRTPERELGTTIPAIHSADPRTRGL